MILNDNECLYWENEDGENVLVVWNDDFPSNPREDFEYQDDHMICFSSRYKLGDEHDYASPYEFVFALADEFHVKYDGSEAPDTIMDRLADRGHIVYMPLWVYEHSGLAISCGERVYPFNDRWDSYQVGYIFMTRKEAISFGYTPKNWKEKALSYMTEDVKIYNYYISGEVYGYTHYLRRKEDNVLAESFEDHDTCSGFYGPDIDENCLRECACVPKTAEIRKTDSLFKGVETA